VIALGVAPSYFGHDEFRAHAPCLKNLSDAELVRSRVLGAYELAEQSDDPVERVARSPSCSSVPARPASSWPRRSRKWRV
jgi:NADH dehydrogenase